MGAAGHPAASAPRRDGVLDGRGGGLDQEGPGLDLLTTKSTCRGPGTPHGRQLSPPFRSTRRRRATQASISDRFSCAPETAIIARMSRTCFSEPASRQYSSLRTMRGRQHPVKGTSSHLRFPVGELRFMAS